MLGLISIIVNLCDNSVFTAKQGNGCCMRGEFMLGLFWFACLFFFEEEQPSVLTSHPLLLSTFQSINKTRMLSQTHLSS